jgi:CheY-like chemotaxis protein
MSDTGRTQQTILVVEDEILVRAPIANYLRQCGYRIVEACNGDEAVTVLLHGKLDIDLVFTDIEMPGSVDGFGLAKWIREHRPGMDILLAGTLPRTIEFAKQICAKGPVPKPYEAIVVHSEIRRLLSAHKSKKPT